MRGLWVVAALLIGGVSPLKPVCGSEVDAPLKEFIRAVSLGELKVTQDQELGVLNPFFIRFESLGTYDDEDVFLALGRNSERELVLFGWMKSSRQLTLDQATDRWVEEKLASVQTEEDLQAFQDFRRLVRGAIYDVKAQKQSLEAVAFLETMVFFGETTEEAVLQQNPVGFRFVPPSQAQVTLVQYELSPKLLAFLR